MNKHSFAKAVKTAAIIATTAVAFAPAAYAAPPWSAGSGGSPQLLYEWSGRVDKEIRVEMRSNRTAVDWIGNRETDRGRTRLYGSLPRTDDYITVQKLEGRGRVDIVQQPSRQNGYTAIIRIRDTQSGASHYRVRVYTTAATSYRGNGNGNAYGKNRGRGHGRDHDDDHDNGRWHDQNDSRDSPNHGGWN